MLFSWYHLKQKNWHHWHHDCLIWNLLIIMGKAFHFITRMFRQLWKHPPGFYNKVKRQGYATMRVCANVIWTTIISTNISTICANISQMIFTAAERNTSKGLVSLISHSQCTLRPLQLDSSRISHYWHWTIDKTCFLNQECRWNVHSYKVLI